MFAMASTLVFASEVTQGPFLFFDSSDALEYDLEKYRKLDQDAKKLEKFSGEVKDEGVMRAQRMLMLVMVKQRNDFAQMLVEKYPNSLTFNSDLKLMQDVPMYDKYGNLRPLFTKCKKVEAQEGCCSIM